jgi:hypothetical protein
MAGILDSRSRIVDFILTGEGKKDLAAGKLDISFATFTDAGTYYQSDSSGVRITPEASLTFESYASYGDVITLEKDLDGSILSIPPSPSAATFQSISGASREDRLKTFENTVLRTGEILDAMSLIRSDTTFENFDDSIVQSRDTINVTRTDYVYGQETVPLSDLSYVFLDGRFKNFDSFKYLPPEVETDSGTSQVFRFSQIPELFSFSYFNPQTITAMGSIDFSPETPGSKISVAAQIFEYDSSSDISSTWSKLDCFYFGPSVLGDGTNAHVFFAGKRVERDQAFSFINLFTILVRY